MADEEFTAEELAEPDQETPVTPKRSGRGQALQLVAEPVSLDSIMDKIAGGVKSVLDEKKALLNVLTSLEKELRASKGNFNKAVRGSMGKTKITGITIDTKELNIDALLNAVAAMKAQVAGELSALSRDVETQHKSMSTSVKGIMGALKAIQAIAS